MESSLLVVIIIIILFNYLVERILDFLNSKSRRQELPPNLSGIYKSDEYKKSVKYDIVKSRFSTVVSTINLALIITLLLSHSFGWLNDVITGWTDNKMYQSLLFFGILFIAGDFFNLPFSIYSTFVIEQNFNFNNTTIKIFILDKIKQIILAILIGGPLMALFIWFYQTTGTYFWLYSWGVFSVFSIGMAILYTSVILPLFNKLKPLEDGELKTAIADYCRKINFTIKDIYIMDGSKRSNKANAFFSGMGPKKKIVLFDTLVANHTTSELVAVLAHEIGHYKKHHIRNGLILGVLQFGIILYLLGWLVGNPDLSIAMGATETSFPLGLLAFALLFSPVSLVLDLGMNFISRQNEYEADHFAAITWNSKSLADALKKLSANNLSNLLPHPAYVFFHYSHPTLSERLTELEKVPDAV